jgi:hypothetical protein
LIRADRADELDEFGHAYAVIAICQCGHAAEISDGWVQVKAGRDKAVEQLRARLRCGKCGARMPRIEIYRRPV